MITIRLTSREVKQVLFELRSAREVIEQMEQPEDELELIDRLIYKFGEGEEV